MNHVLQDFFEKWRWKELLGLRIFPSSVNFVNILTNYFIFWTEVRYIHPKIKKQVQKFDKIITKDEKRE